MVNAVQIQETGVEKPIRLQITHGRQKRFPQMRVILLDFTEQAADGLSHGAGPFRTAARARWARPETRRIGW